MLERLIATLRALRPDLYRQIDAQVTAGTVTEEDVLAQLQAAVRDPAQAPDLTAQVTAIVAQVLAAQKPAAADSDALKETRLLACRLQLRDELGASQLPDPVKQKLTRRYEGQVFELATLQAAIKDEKETLDQLTASGAVLGAGGVRVTGDDLDARKQMLADFFAGDKGVHSIKACYQHITGDTGMTGRVSDARILASLDRGTWADIFGDVMHKTLLAQYNAAGLDDWRKLVNVVPLADLELRHFTQTGGYGDLPAVAEGGAYGALASPGDVGGSYQPSKRGGTEDLTWEMLLGDKVGAVRRIPVKLGRSAARTLYNFVFGFLRSNAVIYDAQALFHANHANLLTTALDATQLKAGRLQMLKQTEADSAEVLGIGPRYLIVPPDLADAAYALVVTPQAGNFTPTGADALRNQTWDLIVDRFTADANNWYLAADPADIPGIEVGFLGGNQEPEVFVQDLPNVGSMFTNDKLTYKIRHAYGGAVTDYRAFQGNVVA